MQTCKHGLSDKSSVVKYEPMPHTYLCDRQLGKNLEKKYPDCPGNAGRKDITNAHYCLGIFLKEIMT